MSRVRAARSEDRPALLALQAHLPDPAPELLAAALETTGAVDVAAPTDPGGIGILLVSTAGDRPVGYLLAVPGEVVHVAELVVDPDYRREGRATALLSALLDRAGDRPVTLAVAPDNDPARRCYRSLGFRVERRDPEFFEGDPALVMRRDPEDVE